MTETYFFDLDGTLIDSRDGLYMSFRAALKKLGIADRSDTDLAPFLGVPLPEVFRALQPDVDDEGIEIGMAAFREVFEEKGMFIHPLYRGAEAMLEALRRKGARAWVVTSKPEPHAVKIVESLNLSRAFDGVVGAGWDEVDTKETLIARALVAANADPYTVLMLGDRQYDIEGAMANDVFPVGALWGYGSETELADAGCTALVADVDAFTESFV